MIVTLEGTVAEKLGDVLVLEVQGVGYGVLMTAEDAAQLPTGDTQKLYIYEHLRENIHELYGFCRPDTRDLFEILLSVNGVGPKMALSVLNLGTATELRAAIAGGDLKFIQGASGVGKRVAERIIVDLKDKVGLPGVDLAGAGLLQTDGILRQDEAIEALVALGFSPQDAAKALHGVDGSLPTEERVKRALQH